MFSPLFMVHFSCDPSPPHVTSNGFTCIVLLFNPSTTMQSLCFPDLMPSLWSILCGPNIFFWLCHDTFSTSVIP